MGRTGGSRDFPARLAEAWPPILWQDVPVLLAISGGCDSVALLRGLTAIAQSGQGRIVVAHFNHHLRGAASDDDQRWVELLAARMHLECHVGHAHVDERAAQDGDGLEAAARAERYAFLGATAGAVGARYVVTAHTADDQAETILHRVIRGTGLAGLSGIPRVRALDGTCSLIRPLLSFHRRELQSWLSEIGQSYLDDKSNLDPQFTRNRIRHNLLPLLVAEYNTGVVEALLRLGALAGDAQRVMDSLVLPLLDRAVTEIEPDRVALDARHWAEQPEFLVREMFVQLWRKQGWSLQAMGYEEWDRLATLAKAANSAGVLNLPGEFRACRDGSAVTIRRGR